MKNCIFKVSNQTRRDQIRSLPRRGRLSWTRSPWSMSSVSTAGQEASRRAATSSWAGQPVGRRRRCRSGRGGAISDDLGARGRGGGGRMGGCACYGRGGRRGGRNGASLSPADLPAGASWWPHARGGRASSTDRRPRPGLDASALRRASPARRRGSWGRRRLCRFG
jgi:hypothetical protein